MRHFYWGFTLRRYSKVVWGKWCVVNKVPKPISVACGPGLLRIYSMWATHTSHNPCPDYQCNPTSQMPISKKRVTSTKIPYMCLKYRYRQLTSYNSIFPPNILSGKKQDEHTIPYKPQKIQAQFTVLPAPKPYYRYSWCIFQTVKIWDSQRKASMSSQKQCPRAIDFVRKVTTNENTDYQGEALGVILHCLHVWFYLPIWKACYQLRL